MNKRRLLLMGLITLFVFPIPAFLVLHFIEDFTFLQFIDWKRFSFYPIFIGAIFGLSYALIARELMQHKVFDKLPSRIEDVVKSMNLTWIECVFLSICAGVGEELLFRMGMQFYLGPIITSIIFVAIHGYLNPRNWRMSLYGFIVLPLIIAISFALPKFGLWFCISAHLFYDLLLFLSISDD